MNSFFSQYGHYLLIVLGGFCFFRGIQILITGKLPGSEEAGVRTYSAEGAKRYRTLSAVINILGGVVSIAVAVVKMMNLIDMETIRIVVLIVLTLLVAGFVLIRRSCRNMK